MAQTQAIKHRIRSIGNTRQITKAMELVSASKLRRAQEASIQSRAYTSSTKDILQRLSQLTDAATDPLFQVRSGDRKLIILFSSDQTLAGAYNSNIARKLIETLSSAADKTPIIAVGNQGAKFAARLDNVELLEAFSGWPVRPTSTEVRPIATEAMTMFRDNLIDSVEIIYTHFVSSITQQVVSERLLPATLESTQTQEKSLEAADAIFEPSPKAVLEAMMPRLIEAQLLGAALSAAASEHAMRMLAMKNASDNAADIIDDLTLEYNSARQAGITQELAEITGGAEAIA